MHIEIQAKLHKETPQGTVFYVLAPNKSLTDTISRFSDSGLLQGDMRIDDGRTIRADQRKKAFATIGDISAWNGDDSEVNHWYLKQRFMASTGYGYFSLSDCSVTTARLYINYLLDFCFEWDVPLSESIAKRADDIGAWMYSGLMHGRCAVCGVAGELHHVTPVGIGRNRREIVHLGMEVMCLCRVHHTQCHTIGQAAFDGKYHVFGIAADERICERWKLKQA